MGTDAAGSDPGDYRRLHPLFTELIYLDVDVHMLLAWQMLWDVGDQTDVATLAAILRTAWMVGYDHGVRERRRGDCYRRHGIPIPPRSVN